MMEPARGTHSVREHLRLRENEYDRIIRTFIPGYDAMLGTMARLVAQTLPPASAIIDLGGGTGSLAFLIAEAIPNSTIEIRDVDPHMLAIAEERLSKFCDRIQVRQKSFEDPLTECDAIVASLSLHHLPTLAKKAELYSRIGRALRKPGVFLIGDVTMSPDVSTRRVVMSFWEEFMMSQMMTREEVQQHFADWAREDTYFSLLDEFSALRSAGFHQPECFWKYGPVTVFGGIRSD